MYDVCIEKHPDKDWWRAAAYQVTEKEKKPVCTWTWSTILAYPFVERCARQLRVRYGLEGKIVVGRLGLYTEVTGWADNHTLETIYRNTDPQIVKRWLEAHGYEQVSIDPNVKRKRYRVCGEWRKI